MHWCLLWPGNSPVCCYRLLRLYLIAGDRLRTPSCGWSSRRAPPAGRAVCLPPSVGLLISATLNRGPTRQAPGSTKRASQDSVVLCAPVDSSYVRAKMCKSPACSRLEPDSCTVKFLSRPGRRRRGHAAGGRRAAEPQSRDIQHELPALAERAAGRQDEGIAGGRAVECQLLDLATVSGGGPVSSCRQSPARFGRSAHC